MKTILLLFNCILLAAIHLPAQISINPDATPPHASAMLDVNATNRGILIPRMTTAERNAIPTPATGLLIYNTTTNLINYFNGSFWYEVQAVLSSGTTGSVRPGGGVSVNAVPGIPADSSAILDVVSSTRGVLIPRTTPESVTSPATGLIIYNTSNNLISYFNGTSWPVIGATSTAQAAAGGSQASLGLAIKTDATVPHSSALLDVAATNKGLLIPRLTGVQRDQLLPVAGLVIYNTITNVIEYFNGTSWYGLKVYCGNQMVDPRDSQGYNTVQIGTQCWMAESLNYGLVIASNTQMSNNSIAEKYCYDNEETKCQEWGALYQWDEAMQYVTTQGTQGICPPLWHIPSEAEWVTLEDFLGGKNVAGGKMKEAGTIHWISNSGATNSSGFTAIASGFNEYSGPTPSSGLWTHNYIWASTESGTTAARRRGLFYFSNQSYPYYDLKWLGFSVRCVKD